MDVRATGRQRLTPNLPLAKEDPLVAELRLLCRDEVALIAECTALIKQLQSALHEYYPAALEAFEDWTTIPNSIPATRSNTALGSYASSLP
jgi:hypothetical protein